MSDRVFAQNRKKQRERFLLKQFFEDATLPAEIVEDREAPDFIVQFEGRRIGVEVTQLFISHDTTTNLMQAQESISTKTISKARHIYDASGGPPAHVSVCFSLGRDLRKMNRDSAASALAAFVRKLDLTVWQRVDWRPVEIEGPLPEEISFVHALGVPARDLAHWTVARAGWATPVIVDDLQKRINEKATRLAKYQETVRENWLVIIADATKPSGLFDARSQIDVGTATSPFSRTYFYGYPDRIIIGLGTKSNDLQSPY